MATYIWVYIGPGAWWHQAITWTNFDFSLVRFCGINLRAISLWMPKQLFCVMCLEIVVLKQLAHLPGDNELSKSLEPNKWIAFYQSDIGPILWHTYVSLDY